MNKTAKKGFTLIELLTVIAIIGILAGILIPAVNRVRTSARQSVDTNNVRQIGLAMNIFADENRERLPAPEDVGELAALLANEVDLTDPNIWISPQGFGNLEFDFDSTDGYSTDDTNNQSDYVVLVSEDEDALLRTGRIDSAVPMVFLTGLQDDGTWDDDETVSPYRDRGGAVSFAGGSAAFVSQIGGDDYPFPRDATDMTETTPAGGAYIDSDGDYSF
ncbi:MAG: prepilin-type N-terminal cleavage/methylation domain-containing protein [Opitutales bacterium]|nr:prepilin-type N-terminal cleavage/methylation domain-containing protein [Opitutales bacterium]